MTWLIIGPAAPPLQEYGICTLWHSVLTKVCLCSTDTQVLIHPLGSLPLAMSDTWLREYSPSQHHLLVCSNRSLFAGIFTRLFPAAKNLLITSTMAGGSSIPTLPPGTQAAAILMQSPWWLDFIHFVPPFLLFLTLQACLSRRLLMCFLHHLSFGYQWMFPALRSLLYYDLSLMALIELLVMDLLKARLAPRLSLYWMPILLPSSDKTLSLAIPMANECIIVSLLDYSALCGPLTSCVPGQELPREYWSRMWWSLGPEQSLR